MATRLDTEERKGQILDAARRLFAERPYGEVSTAEIAEAAGVTRGLVHHYFGAKRELYLDAVRQMVSMMAGTRDGRQMDWEESVDAWMDLLEANREAWILAVSAGETGQDRAMQEILYEARARTAAEVMMVLGFDAKRDHELRSLVMAFGRFAEEISLEWLERGHLSRDQARVLLAGALPLMVDKLLPQVIGRPDRPAKRGA